MDQAGITGQHWAQAAVEPFIKWVQSSNFTRKYSRHTVRAMGPSLSRFAEFLERSLIDSPDEVGVATMRQFRSYLIDHGLKQASIEQNMSFCDFFFDYMIFLGKIESNPVELFKSSEKNKKRHGGRKEKRMTPVLYIHEQEDLIERELDRSHAFAGRNAAVMGFLLDSGLRVSELNSLSVRQGIDLLQTGTVRVIGKGNKERQVRPMSNYARVWRSWIEKRIDQPSAEPVLPLFPSKEHGNKPMSQTTVYTMVTDALARCGIEKPQEGAHLLRHSAASRMLHEGRNLREVQETLGHSSIVVTEQYLHLL